MIDPMWVVAVGLLLLAAHHWYGLHLHREWRLEELTRSERNRSRDREQLESDIAKHESRHDNDATAHRLMHEADREVYAKIQAEQANCRQSVIEVTRSLGRITVEYEQLRRRLEGPKKTKRKAKA